jgi:hypothetical protein
MAAGACCSRAAASRCTLTRNTHPSVGKAALRAYVQVLHDQLAGTSVHATIVTITKGIGSEPRFKAAALAQAYLQLHHQPQTEWQTELVI